MKLLTFTTARWLFLAVFLAALMVAGGCRRRAPVPAEPACSCEQDCCRDRPVRVLVEATAPDHFWEGQRLEAVLEAAYALSRVSGHLFTNAGLKMSEDERQAVGSSYARAIDQARDTVNKYLPILGSDFDKQVSFYLALHGSFRKLGVHRCADYRELAAAVENGLDGVLKAALDGDPIPSLPLNPIRFSERINMTAREYIDAQKQFWTTTQGASRPADEGPDLLKPPRMPPLDS